MSGLTEAGHEQMYHHSCFFFYRKEVKLATYHSCLVTTIYNTGVPPKNPVGYMGFYPLTLPRITASS